MTNTLDVFVDATKAIHALDIPSKEMAEKLVRSAMRMVAEDLQDGNVEGAITTLNKYSTIEQYFRRQHVDLITQNTVGVGRLRLIRPIGGYIKDNYNHEMHLTGKDENGHYSVATTVLPNKYLKDLPISHPTYLKWMDASIPTEEEFDEWAKYYTSEDVKEEDDVHFMLFLRHFFSSKYGGSDNINLLPHIKRAYLAWGEIIDAYLIIDQEIGRGDTPVEQINTLRDQMNKAIEVVNSSIKKMGELYK